MSIKFPNVFQGMLDFLNSGEDRSRLYNLWYRGDYILEGVVPDCITYYMQGTELGNGTIDLLYDRIILDSEIGFRIDGTYEKFLISFNLTPFLSGWTEEEWFQFDIARNTYGISEKTMKIICTIANKLQPVLDWSCYPDLEKI